MAVSQSFRIEVLDCVIQLDRDQAEALAADLNEALGYEDTNLQGALAHLIEMVRQLTETPAFRGYDVEDDGFLQSVQEEPTGETMDIDAFLARQQALAQVGPPAAGGRHPGSGIGNTHIN